MAVVGILVHGDNHFILRGPEPSREEALGLARHWSLIQIGARVPAGLDRWELVTREYRENLAWAVVVPRDCEMSAAVRTLLGEMAERGVVVRVVES